VDSRRFVWFDELFTLDIARSPSLHDLWLRMLRFDNNPPAVYLLSRLSMKILGPTPLGLRFPSIIEFYLASVALFLYAARKLGDALACFAILLLWASPAFYYATEARPYALLLASSAFLLLSWDSAVHGERRRLSLAGVAISTTILLSAHVLAPFSLLPFLTAEAVRFWRRRETDYWLWAALVFPMVLALGYIPLIKVYGGLIITPDNRASGWQIAKFFHDAMIPVAAMLLAGLLAMSILPARKLTGDSQTRFRAEDIALFVCLLLNPALLNLMMMYNHGGFFGRYVIATYAAIDIGIAALIGFRLRPGKAGIVTASLLLVGLIACDTFLNAWRPRTDPIPWASLRPDLPIVAGDGMVFYEMNHLEGAAVLGRLFYLKDRAASLKYVQTNYFQDFEAPDDMKSAGFPITARVEPYDQFVRSHHEFLLYGDSRSWCFRLLKDGGATVVQIGDYSGKTPYKWSDYVYMVTMPKQ
jgi:hypothetical protein